MNAHSSVYAFSLYRYLMCSKEELLAAALHNNAHEVCIFAGSVTQPISHDVIFMWRIKITTVQVLVSFYTNDKVELLKRHLM